VYKIAKLNDRSSSAVL